MPTKRRTPAAANAGNRERAESRRVKPKPAEGATMAVAHGATPKVTRTARIRCGDIPGAQYIEIVEDPLYRPLLAAVAVIKRWHNMPGGGLLTTPAFHASMQVAWAVYWRNAPEMAAIREALAGVDLDEVEKLL